MGRRAIAKQRAITSTPHIPLIATKNPLLLTTTTMKLKYFFYLQRSDRRALSILFIGICVVATIFLVGKRHLLSHPNSNISNTTAEQTTDKSSANGTPNTYYKEENGIAIHLQKFDPNTADSTLLLSLGLQPWQVKNIYRYIFRLSRSRQLYSFRQAQTKRLHPFCP